MMSDKQIETAAEAAALKAEWLEEATPPEVDEQLANLWSDANGLYNRLATTKLSLARALGIRPEYVTKTRREVRQSIEELLVLAEIALADEETPAWTRRDIEQPITTRNETLAKLKINRDEAKPMEARFEREGWSRFFLVNNTGGHIHSSMHCSTCHPTTSFSWLPTLSGLTEEDAVKEHGTILCSVCFPSAPVEWTVGHQKDTSNECPGSRSYDYDEGTWHQTSYTGTGHATCRHCGQSIGTSKQRKMRRHDKPEAK